MGLPQPVKRYVIEEYYGLEREAPGRSEFYQGEIFAMAGASATHSRICSNLIREAGSQLKGKPCEVFESNLRLRIKATGLRTYPDASVFCGSLEKDPEDPNGETYVNPTVVIEVLSRSTEGYDRGFKSENYRQIESLQAYILLSQSAPHAESYERQIDGSWVLREVRGLDAMLAIPAIGVNLSLREIYERVNFADAQGPWAAS
jgi:Uma2 family endonuclease